MLEGVATKWSKWNLPRPSGGRDIVKDECRVVGSDRSSSCGVIDSRVIPARGFILADRLRSRRTKFAAVGTCYRNGDRKPSVDDSNDLLGAEDKESAVSDASFDFGQQEETSGMRQESLQEVWPKKQP